ncbi:MAG: hypothetical protein AABW56_03330 [Nanoarchaeota archaeon]
MKYCPKCKSADIHPYLPGFFNMYKCKKCDYVGTVVIERSEKKRIVKFK